MHNIVDPLGLTEGHFLEQKATYIMHKGGLIKIKKGGGGGLGSRGGEPQSPS